MSKGASEKPKERCPEKFIKGDWVYLHTLVVQGDNQKLFLEYAGFDPKKPELFEEFDGSWRSSAHHILAGVDPIKIDVYKGRTAITTSNAFQGYHGRIFTMLLQSGYEIKNIKIKQDSAVVKAGQVNDLTNRLTF